MADTKSLSKLKSIELKKKLTALGKTPKGLKANLVKQLQAAIAEQNSRSNNVGDDSHKLPQSQEYQTSTESQSLVNEPNFNFTVAHILSSIELSTQQLPRQQMYTEALQQVQLTQRVLKVNTSVPEYMSNNKFAGVNKMASGKLLEPKTKFSHKRRVHRKYVKS